MSTVIDSYSESNQSSSIEFGYSSYCCYQSFTGDGNEIRSVKLYLKRGEIATSGNISVDIWNHAGTYGTSSYPTGPSGLSLVTSDSYDSSNLTTSYQLVEFTFSVSERITLSNGTYYCLSVGGWDEGNGSRYAGSDNTSPTHGGNSGKDGGGEWQIYSGVDLCFYVYGEPPTIVVSKSDSVTVSDSPTVGTPYPPNITKSESVGVADSPTVSVQAATPLNITTTGIVDYYADWDATSNIGAYDNGGFGQSFTGDGGVLNNSRFYLYREGSPTGSAYAKVYAHTGTFGTTSMPTGSALATSDAFDVSTLSELDFVLKTFTFSGANKITLTNTTKYVVTIEFSGGDYENWVYVRGDTAGSHAGNSAVYDTQWWVDAFFSDLCFYVYKDGVVTESVSVSDSPTVFLQLAPADLSINKSEAVSVAETKAVTLTTPSKSLTQAVSVQETVTVGVSTPAITKTESVGVSDTLVLLLDTYRLIVAEAVSVSDTTQEALTTPSISKIENISVSDSPGVTLPGPEVFIDVAIFVDSPVRIE